jgi:hypothetical protein
MWSRIRNLSPWQVLVGVVVLSSGLALTGSISKYVFNSQEPLASNLATWARDHKLGRVVDELEQLRYGSPPPDKPAEELASVSPSPPSDAPVSLSPTTQPFRPDSLTVRVSPALKHEGEWKAAREVNGTTAIWVTGIRPLKAAPAVTATYALVDQDLTYAAMWNGPEIPGKAGFSRYKAIAPELHPYLLAAFNGGFRREHTRGGYFTEGRQVWKMNPDAATLGIDASGRIHIGRLGQEVVQSDMVSIRQNVRLLVHDAKSVVGGKLYGYGSWKDGNLYILRSAVCIRTDDKLLFAVMGPADAEQLAAALVRAGCKAAMQLDVNASWPKFSIYDTTTPAPHTRWIDKRSTGSSNMFLTSAPKDFFALFDRTLPDSLEAQLK